MKIFNLIRFIREKNTKENDNKIVPPKPMPFTQANNMTIDLVVKKNKE